MAVDLVVTVNKDVPEYSEQYCLHFDDDGYYWFLYPLIEELGEQTGNMIDLYGDARFESEHLRILKNTVEKARALVEQQPPEWIVHTGTQVKPVRKDIQRQVSKKDFLACLDQFDEMIDYALVNNEHIVCLGD